MKYNKTIVFNLIVLTILTCNITVTRNCTNATERPVLQRPEPLLKGLMSTLRLKGGDELLELYEEGRSNKPNVPNLPNIVMPDVSNRPNIPTQLDQNDYQDLGEQSYQVEQSYQPEQYQSEQADPSELDYGDRARGGSEQAPAEIQEQMLPEEALPVEPVPKPVEEPLPKPTLLPPPPPAEEPEVEIKNEVKIEPKTTVAAEDRSRAGEEAICTKRPVAPVTANDLKVFRHPPKTVKPGRCRDVFSGMYDKCCRCYKPYKHRDGCHCHDQDKRPALRKKVICCCKKPSQRKRHWCDLTNCFGLLGKKITVLIIYRTTKNHLKISSFA